jgi:hypothetical protein
MALGDILRAKEAEEKSLWIKLEYIGKKLEVFVGSVF